MNTLAIQMHSIDIAQTLISVGEYNTLASGGPRVSHPRKIFEKCTSYSMNCTARFVGVKLIWQTLNKIK